MANTNSYLTKGQMVAYAAGGVAINLTNLVISQWLPQLYRPAGGEPLVTGVSFLGLALSAGVAFGLFFALGRVTDAITDPLIGYWSDHTRSRRGRRLPFIFWSLLPFAVGFYLLWTPPVAAQSWINNVYIIVLIQLYFILYTALVTPYLALIPEIVSDLGERVNLTTLQAVFVLIGSFVFGATGLIIKELGYGAMGLVVSVIAVVSLAPTLLAIREKPRERRAASAGKGEVNLLKWVAMTWHNPGFLPLVISTSFYWIGLNLMLIFVPSWVKTSLGLQEDAATVMMIPFLLTNLAFFFVFNHFAKIYGKHRMFLICLAGTAAAMPLMLLVGVLPGVDKLIQSAVVMGLVGIPAAGFMMLPFALLSDIADYDETLTGRRREAIFFGVQAIFQKTAIGLSIPLFYFLAEFQDGKTTTETGLKYVAVAGGLACLAGFFVFLKYPLREREGRVVNIREAGGPG